MHLKQNAGYILAMAKRFPADPKADRRKAAEEYRDAMREVAKNYPDDRDAATLFAESGMDLNPWALWHQDGTPAEGTNEIGRNFGVSDQTRSDTWARCITTFTRWKRRILLSALWLRQPDWRRWRPRRDISCICRRTFTSRTGDYAAAVKTNEQAAAADRAYIQSSGVQGIYPMMYYSHIALHRDVLGHDGRLHGIGSRRRRCWQLMWSRPLRTCRRWKDS